jgi:hypothetical protein
MNLFVFEVKSSYVRAIEGSPFHPVWGRDTLRIAAPWPFDQIDFRHSTGCGVTLPVVSVLQNFF